jgi:hypothetical protein
MQLQNSTHFFISDSDSSSDSDSDPRNITRPETTSYTNIIRQYTDQQHLLRQAKSKSLQRSRPPPALRTLDPIITITAPQKIRHRLVKWRMHWLPPHPSIPCPCNNSSPTNRHHFTYECSRLEPIIIQLHVALAHFHLPPPPSTSNIIDHFLNLIPIDQQDMLQPKSHWKQTWPLITQALFLIDQLTHPDSPFDDEPNAFSWLDPPPTTATSPTLSSLSLTSLE